MTFKEIFLDILAISCMEEIIVEAMLDLSHKEIAWINLTINSNLWVRHYHYYQL